MSETHRRSPAGPTERVVAGTTVVGLSGEIDILAQPALSARLDALTSGPRPEVVVDLRSVSFIDCSGLNVLCRARIRVAARRGRLRLVADSPRFLRLLRLLQLADAFDVYARLSDALAAAAATRGAQDRTG
ncbi:STAS domain-containing protein [Streptomyces sp. NPDC085946]|uniref:STAS domain-containing protein n=1 Tax=Streptomyces sp. NPDC085946 TaxID=3365744 RepID=UPI0037D881F8